MTMSKFIALTIDKKLVFLVIAVSLIGIGLTVFLSFHYSKVILGERATYQLIGEAAIRGGTIERVFNTKMQEIQVITTNPMIRNVVSELNLIQDKQILIENIENKRTDLLIEIQAFEVSIGGLDDLENVEILGNHGQVLFSLVNNKSKRDFSLDPTYIHGKKEPFSQIILGKDGKRKIVTAAPIFEKTDDSSAVGVAIVTANTNQIDNVLLNRKGLGKTGESYLIDMSGNMISESRFIPNAAFKQNVNTKPRGFCLADGQIYFGTHDDYRGIPVIGSSLCMKTLGMITIVEIDESEVFEPVSGPSAVWHRRAPVTRAAAPPLAISGNLRRVFSLRRESVPAAGTLEHLWRGIERRRAAQNLSRKRSQTDSRGRRAAHKAARGSPFLRVESRSQIGRAHV
mgnify:CR=1 FL=1